MWLEHSLACRTRALASVKTPNRYCICNDLQDFGRLSYSDNWPSSFPAGHRGFFVGRAVLSFCSSVRWYAWPVTECCAVISPSRQRWHSRDLRTALVRRQVMGGNRFSICCRRVLNVIIHRWVASRAPALRPAWSLIDYVANGSGRFSRYRWSSCAAICVKLQLLWSPYVQCESKKGCHRIHGYNFVISSSICKILSLM